LNNPLHTRRLPKWVKLVFMAWILFWAPAYAVLLGAQNFFWLCNLASFLILAGLWLESRVLLSMQWLSVALIGLLWGIDLGVAWLTGWHPFGGTAYMFDPEFPDLARVLSFYHLLLPVVAGYAVYRLGYASRALWFQSLLTWVMIGLTYLLVDPERNSNWVHAPFGLEQDFLPPLVYLMALALAWPVLIYLPVHALSRRRLHGRGHR
jgi:hypothetical protein